MYSRWKAEGDSALVDRRGRPAGTSLDQWMIEVILQYYQGTTGNITVQGLLDVIHEKGAEQGLIDFADYIKGEKSLVSYGRVNRWLKNYKADNPKASYLLANGLDKFTNKHMPAMGSRAASVTRPNQLWEIDSTPLDMIVIDDATGKQMRPAVLMIVDYYSKRCVQVVSETSNAQAVIRLIWKAISIFGLPETIKGDNGADYTSAQVAGCLADLGIAYDATTPYSGWEKGLIERAVGTLNHSLSQRLIGYIGHCVADRQTIEQQTPKHERLSGKELTHLKTLLHLSEIEVMIDNWNAQRELTRRKGKPSPLDRWNEFADSEQDTITYERFLLSAGVRQTRRIGKEGVRWRNGIFVSPILVEIEGEIEVRENIDDSSRVFVFQNGVFICEARDRALAPLSAEERKQADKSHKAFTRATRTAISQAQSGMAVETRNGLKRHLDEMNQQHQADLRNPNFNHVDGTDAATLEEQRLIEEVRSMEPVIPGLAPDSLSEVPEAEEEETTAFTPETTRKKPSTSGNSWESAIVNSRSVG